MTSVTSFEPIADESAHTLILGSMPGVASLKADQYYAHPRNAFWPIMAGIFNFNPELAYEDRLHALKRSGIALWDVLQNCKRIGSLDSAIETGSRVPNDFPAFFKKHAKVITICFNGAEAEKSFNRYVLPNINSTGKRFYRLPSSSPAHAVAMEHKAKAWREKLGAESVKGL